MKKIFIFCLLLLASFVTASAQKGVTTVGLQVKPIFPLNFVNTGSQTIIQNNARFDLTLSSGFSGGLIIRHGFTDLLAFEIRFALQYLGEITGEIYTDDLLANIFSKFCIGK